MAGISMVLDLVSDFFGVLPEHVVMSASFVFLGLMVIGFFGWFK